MIQILLKNLKKRFNVYRRKLGQLKKPVTALIAAFQKNWHDYCSIYGKGNAVKLIIDQVVSDGASIMH